MNIFIHLVHLHLDIITRFVSYPACGGTLMNEHPVKQTVLVADDAPMNIDVLTETLQDEYHVKAANQIQVDKPGFSLDLDTMALSREDLEVTVKTLEQALQILRK